MASTISKWELMFVCYYIINKDFTIGFSYFSPISLIAISLSQC